MTSDSENIWFDREDEEFAESLIGLNLRWDVPSPSALASEAAEWIKQPRLMLQCLTGKLNELLDRCEARLFNGMSIQLKPEFLGNSEENLWEIAWLVIDWGFQAETLEMVNLIQPTPFDVQTIRDLSRVVSMKKGNTQEFHELVSRYKSQLQRLADWIRMKEILSGRVDLDSTADSLSGTRKPAATREIFRQAYFDVVATGETPTKERVGDLIQSRGFSIGTPRAHSWKHELEKQSAVRPPESAD